MNLQLYFNLIVILFIAIPRGHSQSDISINSNSIEDLIMLDRFCEASIEYEKMFNQVEHQPLIYDYHNYYLCKIKCEELSTSEQTELIKRFIAEYGLDNSFLINSSLFDEIRADTVMWVDILSKYREWRVEFIKGADFDYKNTINSLQEQEGIYGSYAYFYHEQNLEKNTIKFVDEYLNLIRERDLPFPKVVGVEYSDIFPYYKLDKNETLFVHASHQHYKGISDLYLTTVNKLYPPEYLASSFSSHPFFTGVTGGNIGSNVEILCDDTGCYKENFDMLNLEKVDSVRLSFGLNSYEKHFEKLAFQAESRFILIPWIGKAYLEGKDPMIEAFKMGGMIEKLD